MRRGAAGRTRCTSARCSPGVVSLAGLAQGPAGPPILRCHNTGMLGVCIGAHPGRVYQFLMLRDARGGRRVERREGVRVTRAWSDVCMLAGLRRASPRVLGTQTTTTELARLGLPCREAVNRAGTHQSAAPQPCVACGSRLNAVCQTGESRTLGNGWFCAFLGITCCT